MCFEVSAQASEVEKREGSLFIRELATDGVNGRERICVAQRGLEPDPIDGAKTAQVRALDRVDDAIE